MSCCENNNNCNKRRQAMLDLGSFVTLGEQSASIIGHLLAVARTGIVDMLYFKDNTTQALAMEIQRLWVAAQIGKLADHPAVRVNENATDVVIEFGPGKNYTLKIPVVGSVAKKELADSLRTVAAVLDPGAENQLPLPFPAEG